MKFLDGSELTGYIEERQAKQVRALRQSWRVFPKLAIVRQGESQVTDTYLRLKQQYGEEILVDVVIEETTPETLLTTIERLNSDELVHGIIIQLPLSSVELTDAAVRAVSPSKDVDGLGEEPAFTPATAMAIDWLVAGYGVDLSGKHIAIVGNGRLVGAPLHSLWTAAGYDVTVYDDQTIDLPAKLLSADIIVTATGMPALITSAMVKQGAVVVDAGTASENGKIVGDVAADVRERNDLTITPIRGGVGPLTIAALFDNAIAAARKIADQKGQQDLN